MSTEQKGFAPTNAKKRYDKLATDREIYLSIARESVLLTIPSLLKQYEGNTPAQLVTPYQSMGARGVNNLSSKFLLTLLPPNTPFFKLQIDRFVLEEGGVDAEQITKIEKALADIEKGTGEDIEASGDRVVLHETLKHLIVTGNALIYLDKDEGMRLYHLDRFTVLRDGAGNVVEMVVKDSVAPSALPVDFLEVLKENPEFKQLTEDESTTKDIDIYTHLERDGKSKWTIYQEVYGLKVPESDGTYPVHGCPWIPLRFSRVDGESYGRGYIEEYLGDLNSLEKATKAIIESGLAAAKLLFLVNPNGITKINALAKAENCDFVAGSANDIAALQAEKHHDLSTAFQTIRLLTERLSFAFLLNSSVQRDAERVTAEEIRYMARELEDALGGTYAILSKEFQLPYVEAKLKQLQRAKRIPMLPKDTVHPVITTGLEALGRGHDAQKLKEYIQDLSEALGPEMVAKLINISEFAERMAIARGIDTEGLVNPPEVLAQQEQMSQMQAMVEKLGPNAINAMSQAGQQVPTGEVPNA